MIEFTAVVMADVDLDQTGWSKATGSVANLLKSQYTTISRLNYSVTANA
jgi:hypothetical protein